MRSYSNNKGYINNGKFDWDNSDEIIEENSNSSNIDDESSFDPMEARMREHQYHKIQEELKRTDENQKKQVKKRNSSDENFSQSDISREEAEEANVLWMSTKKTTKLAFISNKEQGQDEQQKVSFLNLHINRHEENK